VITAMPAKASHSAGPMPMSTATGPHSARPAGANTSEPNQS
jgi:hypothetical protein